MTVEQPHDPRLVEVQVTVDADPGVIASIYTLESIGYLPGQPYNKIGLAVVEVLTLLKPQRVSVALISGPDPDGTETWLITATVGAATHGPATGDLRVTAVLDPQVTAAIHRARDPSAVD